MGHILAERIKKIKKLIIVQAVVAIALWGALLYFRGNSQIYSPTIDCWQSRFTTYNGSWYGDENIWKSGMAEPWTPNDFLFGPGISLPKGEYIVQIDYSCDNNQSFYLHAFEQDDRISAGTGELKYSQTSSVLKFTIKEPVDNFEVRVSYDGHGYINVNNIMIATAHTSFKTFTLFVVLFLILTDAVYIIAPLFKKRDSKFAIGNVFPWICALAAFAVDVYFMAAYGKAVVDSDVAAQVAKASLMKESFSLIPSTWYYSTGISLFGDANYYHLGLLLFPSSWNLARTFGMCIQLLLFAGAAFLSLKKFGIEVRNIGYSIAVMLSPLGVWSIWTITYGGFYLQALINTFLIMAIMIFSWEATEKKKIAFWTVLLVVVSALNGFDSIKGIMYLCAPLFAAAFILLVIEGKKNSEVLKNFKSKEIRMIVIILISSAASVAGYAVNSIFFSSKYILFNMSERYISMPKFDSLFTVWEWFMSLFGFQDVLKFHNLVPSKEINISLMSFRGVMSFVGIFIAVLVIFSEIRLLKNLNKLTYLKKLIVLFFGMAFLMLSILFAWTVGTECNLTYWIPVIPFAFVIIAIEFETEEWGIELYRKAVPVIFMIMVAGVSTASLMTYAQEPVAGNSSMEDVGVWLLNNGYTKGYSTYWYAGQLEYVSDGQIEMWSTSCLGGYDAYEWLQAKSHKDKVDGKSFLLIGPWNLEGGLVSSVCDNHESYDYSQLNMIYKNDEGIMIFETPDWF